MNILRLSRTLPRENLPGAGLQPYYCRRYSRYQSANFTRFANDKLLAHVVSSGAGKIFQVPFFDSEFKNAGVNPFILTYKIIWAVISFFWVFSILLANRIRFDVIHCHSIHFIVAGFLLKIIYRKPLCLSVGGSEVLRLRHLPIIKYFPTPIDCLFYVAEAMRPELEKSFPDIPLIHIGNGVDPDIFYPLNNPREELIVLVGNVRWQKGYDILIAALAKADVNFQCVIVGEKNNKYFSDVIRPKISEDMRISFIGSKSQEEINLLFNRAKLFVLPSVSEGIPKVVIEAMSAGLPVVATDVGDVKKIVGGAGIIVPPKDPEALRSAISKLMTDDDLWELHQKQSLFQSSFFSWQKLVSKFDNTYDELVNRS